MGDCINMHLLQFNNNKTNSTSQVLNLTKSCNTLISDLSQWNMFIKGLLLTSIDLPIANMQSYIIDASTDKLNFTITLYDTIGYNFFITGVNTYYKGIDEDIANPGYYKGILIYLRWIPETAATSSDSTYYLLHYVQNFLDICNTAIKTGLNLHTNAQIASSNVFLSYIPGSPYVFQIDNYFLNSTVDIYFNSFTKRVLDGFRVSYVSYTDITSPTYTGMNYLFNKKNTLNNNVVSGSSDYWIFKAEFSCVNSLSTYVGLALEISGNLSGVRDTVYSYFDSSNSNVNLQTKKILKILDFTIDNYNSIVGSNYLQYESIFSADAPINFLNNESLNNLGIQFYLINNDGSFSSINLPANSTVKLNVLFKRR